MVSYKILISVNVLIYALPVLADFILKTDLHLITLSFASLKNFNNSDFSVYQLLTAIFLHSNFLHVFMNMYALGPALGEFLNKLFGESRFLLIYFFSGICGSLLSASFLPINGASVGASGAIMGLAGSLMAYGLKTKSEELTKSILTIVILNLLLGLSFPNIDNFAHLGGFTGGLVLGWFLITPKMKLPEIKKYQSPNFQINKDEIPAASYVSKQP
jgi:rhomboid protease GluP